VDALGPTRLLFVLLGVGVCSVSGPWQAWLAFALVAVACSRGRTGLVRTSVVRPDGLPVVDQLIFPLR
jgi:hypothetical protein